MEVPVDEKTLRECTIKQAREALAKGQRVVIWAADTGLGLLTGIPEGEEYQEVATIVEQPDWWCGDSGRYGNTFKGSGQIYDNAYKITCANGREVPVFTEIGWWVCGGAIYIQEC